MKVQIAAAALLTVAALPQGASAHHSFAMFDNAKTVSLSGTVREFQYTNPHSWVQLLVPNATGGVDEWSLEGGSPNGMARQGWRKTSVKAGDKVVIKIHPLKNGTKGGSLMNITFEDGHVLGNGPGGPPPGGGPGGPPGGGPPGGGPPPGGPPGGRGPGGPPPGA